MAYTDQFKEEVVTYALNVPEDQLEQVAERYDVKVKTLAKWLDDIVIVTEDEEPIEEADQEIETETETETEQSEGVETNDSGDREETEETSPEENEVQSEVVVEESTQMSDQERNRLRYLGYL